MNLSNAFTDQIRKAQPAHRILVGTRSPDRYWLLGLGCASGGQLLSGVALWVRGSMISIRSSRTRRSEYMTAGRYSEGLPHSIAPNPSNQMSCSTTIAWIGDMPSAEAYFRRSVQTYHDPDVETYDYVLYRLGLSQYAQGKMPEAEATLRQQSIFSPKASDTMSRSAVHEGNLAEAKSQLELELVLGPDQQASSLLTTVKAELAAADSD